MGCMRKDIAGEGREKSGQRRLRACNLTTSNREQDFADCLLGVCVGFPLCFVQAIGKWFIKGSV